MGSSGCALGQRSVFDVVMKYNEDESLDSVRLYAESIPEVVPVWVLSTGTASHRRCCVTPHRNSLRPRALLSHHRRGGFGEATSIECLGVPMSETRPQATTTP